MASKYFQILQRLINKTADKSIEWKETARENAFQVSFSNYSIVLSEERSEDSPDAFDYIVSIMNQNGTVIDRFSDVTLRSELTEFSPPLPYQLLRQLFEQARRQALGVENALDEILKDLDE